MQQTIIFIVGLTAVGKSSTVASLKSSYTLLPNRRELTDRIIIPTVQRHLGQTLEPVTDRLKRFEMTRHYRSWYPDGMIHALCTHLVNDISAAALLFDSIRGVTECQAAVRAFGKSRFIVLDASPMVRLKRLTGRSDSFDQVNATRLENTSFSEKLLSIDGLEQLFDLYELARFEATTALAEERILDAVRIILSEHQHYDATAATEYLKSTLQPQRLLYIDTAEKTMAEVSESIERWL